MKHNLGLETHISFEGDSTIYITSDYTDVITGCKTPCNEDHDDCYTEPYILVRSEIRTAIPLSKLNNIFDESGYGRKATENDKKVI